MSDLTAIQMCRAALAEMDPQLQETDPTWSVAAILLCAMNKQLSADEGRIAHALEMDDDFVRLVGSRFRSSGIWQDDRVALEHQYHEKEGGITFWMHCSVGLGNMIRHDDDMFSMTEQGKRDALRRIGRATDKE